MSEDSEFSRAVAAKVARKLRAQLNSNQGVLFGLWMMGLVGWSVAIPALAGTAFGIWLDSHHPGNHSWTLALLIAGLVLGCFNAWHWVDKENKEMREDQENHDD